MLNTNFIPSLPLFAVLVAGCAHTPIQQQVGTKPLAPIEDVDGLPRVLLIGDSISIGYTLPVRGLLLGKANVHRPPENSAYTGKGLEKLDQWLGHGRWDVIHFNWGLHDLKYVDEDFKIISPEKGERVHAPEVYEANLDRLVHRLRETGATLIFATTTPVPEGANGRIPGDAAWYNEIARRVMKRRGVEINDLHGLVLPQLDDVQRPANVHFVDTGSQLLAERVAARIEGALRERRRASSPADPNR